MPETEQQNAGSADVAMQGGEAARDFSWAEATVWTKRMLSALVNGVKGGKWYALMDKVFAPDTLAAAWTKVRSNKGAAGVDGQSIERFEARAGLYLAELSTALREGFLPPASRQTGRYPEGRWQDEAVGDSDSQGSHRATGCAARDRTDFRGGVP
jgi:RNA-directed DNA polymerase